MPSQSGSLDCSGFFCIIIGSLPYNITCLKLIAIVILKYINKTGLNKLLGVWVFLSFKVK